MALHTTAFHRRLAVALLCGATIWAALALSSWDSLGNGVRFSPPLSDYGMGQTLLFGRPAQALPIAALLALEAASAFLGWRLVIEPLWGKRRLAARPWLIIAGIVPGALLVVATARLATLFLPNAVAPGLVFALVAAATAWLLAADPVPSRSEEWSAPILTGCVAALIGSFVLQMHFDHFHVYGDGSVWFVKNLFLKPEHGLGAPGHWPILGQHYDEAMFLYPVALGLMAPDPDAAATFTVLYWILNALGRLSALSLLFLSLRALGLDRLSAVALLVFLAGGTLSVNPIAGRVLFDALNPLGFGLHEARILMAVFPIILVAAATSTGGKLSARSVLVGGMLGLGLSATPIHGVMMAPFALAVAAVTAANPGAANVPSYWRMAAFACLALGSAISLAYLWRGGPAIGVIAVLVAGATLALLLVLWPLALTILRGERARVPDASLSPGILGAVAVGALAGLVLLGNVSVHATYPALSQFWPWTNLAIVDRLEEAIIPPGLPLARSPFCDGGYWWTHRQLAGHCQSLPRLVTAYGLPFVLAMCVVAWRLLRPRLSQTPRQDTMMLWSMMFCLIAMPFGLAIFDFIAPVESANPMLREFSVWARSRLLEPWFYGAVGLALVLALRGGRERLWIQSALLAAAATFLFNPLVAPAQISANAAALFSRALSLIGG